ncbi:GyrI-like domain-containing protein [Nocardia arthritidis]|uniref:GyrI-like domain-containing protein n=1 Tax=Nocardia arthritidis TaxID=228602 RepID=UPI0009FDB3AC|nr:GyrI-like domain-containing protein [Nocardia arthritidis]
MRYQVALVESAPEAVLRVPREIRLQPDLLGADISEGMREVTLIVQRAGLTASGAPTITFRDGMRADEAVTVEFGVPVEPAPKLGPSFGAQVVVMPETLVARTCHRGSYSHLGAAYQALEQWMREAGYRAIGPSTEAYLIGPDEVSDPHQLLTEVRLPVVPVSAITVHLDAPFGIAVERTREALRHYGLVITAEADMQATLRESIGEDVGNYLLLQICDPELTYRALTVDGQAGLVLSSSVAVRSIGTGAMAEVIDPEVLVRAAARPELRPVAGEMRRRLTSALDSLRNKASAIS